MLGGGRTESQRNGGGRGGAERAVWGEDHLGKPDRGRGSAGDRRVDDGGGRGDVATGQPSKRDQRGVGVVGLGRDVSAGSPFVGRPTPPWGDVGLGGRDRVGDG